MQPRRVLSIREVCSRLSVSRSTLWRLTRAGDLPEPIRLSPNRVGFEEAELNHWLTLRATRRMNRGATQVRGA